jgi:nondiscriminating aspartyl-tRNA synthetase
MERTAIQAIATQVGQTVKLQGFVHLLRDQGKIIFLILRDRTGLAQCVVLPAQAEVFSAAKKLSQESVVEVEGLIKAMPQAPGGYELEVSALRLLSTADPNLPIPIVTKGGQETDQNIRLDYRWLDLRKPDKALIFQVWSTFEQAFIDFFLQEDFLHLHSPKLMSAPSESGAELFSVDYFDQKAFLAQSPQFYKQMAMAAGLERVIEIGPVFRAEPSFTTRHATEFTGFDFEMSFIDSHQDVISIWQQAIVYMLQTVTKQHGPAITKVFGLEVTVPTLPFPQVTMAEAKRLLAEQGIKSEKPGDLNPEEERALCELIAKREGHEFVFVTDYPIESRPFYHMRPAENPELTKSFDLLWKGVEITTGAQREHRYEILRQQAEEKGLNLDEISYYLNFFKYGCPPHGGAGIGPTRMIMQLLGADNIRETTFLHRGVNRLTP